MTRVKMDVMRPWIANRVTELIGFEDEVLINFIYGLLEGKEVNGKQVQITLTGFMERNTGKFMKELWLLLLSAQQNVSGVPQQFLDAKEVETKERMAETDRIANEIQRKKEKEKQEAEQEKTTMGDVSSLRDKKSDLRHNSKQGDGFSSMQPEAEKDMFKRKGERMRSRVLRTPDSSHHSPSPRRKHSKSPSKSSSSVSHSERRSRSRSRARSPRATTREGQTRSSPRQSESPTRKRVFRHSPSPRHRSSYARKRSSPRQHRSRSPMRYRSRSPLQHRSRRSMWRSPVRYRSRTPICRHSRSPTRRRSPSPRGRSPSYRRQKLRSPEYGSSQSPVRHLSSSHQRHASPPRRRYQEVSESTPQRSESPAPHRSANHRKRSSSPSHRRSSSPQESTSPLKRSPPRSTRSSDREKTRVPEKPSSDLSYSPNRSADAPAGNSRESRSVRGRTDISPGSPKREIEQGDSLRKRQDLSPLRKSPVLSDTPRRRSSNTERSALLCVICYLKFNVSILQAKRISFRLQSTGTSFLRCGSTRYVPDTWVRRYVRKYCSMTQETGDSSPLDLDNTAFGLGKNDEDDKWPLWCYVEREKKEGDKGGNSTNRCCFCSTIFRGSYSRVRAHLLKLPGNGVSVCRKITRSEIEELQKLEDEAMNKRQTSRNSTQSTVETESGSSAQASFCFSLPPSGSKGGNKRKASSQLKIDEVFNNMVMNAEQLDALIARMFYSAGLPFHLARNPYYVEAFSVAASKTIPGYKPPGYNKLRTILLKNEREYIEKCLASTKSTWDSLGITLACDGWTDPQRRLLINFIALNEGGAMFVRAVNCESKYKDQTCVASLIEETIKKVGPSRVIQVVTDNAKVCKAAGHIIEKKYPKIFWTPCIVHTLNLVLKDICVPKEKDKDRFNACAWILEVTKTMMKVKQFITNHCMRLFLFKKYSKFRLLNIAETRFASIVIMIRRFVLLKKELKALVISEEWNEYQNDNIAKAREVGETLLSYSFWDSIEYILSFTEPIYDMLRACDTNEASLHLVIGMWDTVIMNVKKAIYSYEKKTFDEECTFWRVVNELLVKRRANSLTPLHALAHTLNPRVYTEEWKNEHPNMPDIAKDKEITHLRRQLVERYFPDQEKRVEAYGEIANFVACLSDFGTVDAMYARTRMKPVVWWVTFGMETPAIQAIAMKILGHVSSSSACERNWSTYKFIHSAKRHKLTDQRAEDLVFVHTNLRLLSRFSNKYKIGESKLWDIMGDVFESGDHGILENATLSFDEPEFEMEELDSHATGEI